MICNRYISYIQIFPLYLNMDPISNVNAYTTFKGCVSIQFIVNLQWVKLSHATCLCSYIVIFGMCLVTCNHEYGLPGCPTGLTHYDDVIMGAMASQITSLTIVNSIIYSGTDQRKHQSSASLAFVSGIHRGPVLFVIYMNDIQIVGERLNLIWYVDDTTLTSTLRTFNQKVNHDVNHMSYLINQGLSIISDGIAVN